MGIFGFTWADAGAVVGATIGGAVLGPPGAMVGGALATYAGATLGDGKGAGQALEEAAVAGIGGAGGAWAADLGGKLLRDGIVRAAGRTLSGSATRQADRIASKVLLPWNKYDASPIAALGGGFAAYEASPQSRSSSGSPVAVRTTDIGNGGCPIEMANLVMPEQLSPSIEKLYRELPGYLCGVWRSFGTGTGTGVVTPKPPTTVAGAARSGIDTYPGKVAELDASITEFATLDRELAPLAQHSGEISARGQQAVTAVIARSDRGAATAPPPGPAADKHALDELDAAFASGQSIFDDAKRGNDHLADRIDALTRRVEKLGERVESGMKRVDRVESLPRDMVPVSKTSIRNITNYIVPQSDTSKSARPAQPLPVPHGAGNSVLSTRGPSNLSTPVFRAPQVAARPSLMTPWTEKALQLPPEPTRGPSEPRASGPTSASSPPIPAPPYRTSDTPPASTATGPTSPTSIRVPPALASPLQSANRQVTPPVWTAPWNNGPTRPERGTPWTTGFSQDPDDRLVSRTKSGSAASLGALNPQVTTAAWHTCRVSRSPCAERGAR